jgi:outer membrane protein assembly factor BamB
VDVRPGGPLRGAPTVADGNVYVMSQDSQIFSLKAADGTTQWSEAAPMEIAGVFGTGAPGVCARHGGGRVRERRSQRLSLRERAAVVERRAVADQHLDSCRRCPTSTPRR